MSTNYPLKAQLADLAELEARCEVSIAKGTATADDHTYLDEVRCERERAIERAVLEARAAYFKTILDRRGHLTRVEEEIDLDARGRLMELDYEEADR